MGPRNEYFTKHRQALVKAGSCRFGANHAAALPMIGLCEACKAKQDARNAKYRALRKKHPTKDE